MKDKFFRKSLVFGIILLFICSSFVSGFNIQINNKNNIISCGLGNTLYVGGEEPENYEKIQDAIDEALDGDTVFVYDDSSPYYENIYIEKSINLIGEDDDTTVIDGNNYGDVVSIYSCKKVLISGFTIQNSGNYTSPFGWINAGVSLWGAYYTSIIGNNIQNNLCGVQLYCSDDNNISGNVISSNEYGVYFPPSLGYCEYNIISGNIIRDNDKGICIISPENNCIVHNNFIKNTLFNALDNFTDLWDRNYWDDYNGSDENNDGIGDIPYLIRGRLGSNWDYHPLMDQWINLPPGTPEITGEINGKARKIYIYTFNATDPDRDNIYYYIDWGDNSVTGWVENFPSGYEKEAMHCWQRGNYIIKVKAKDIWGAESDWSTLQITMSRNKTINTPILNLIASHPIIFPIFQKLLNRFGQ
jgi:parallel beta-helix repeat protein